MINKAYPPWIGGIEKHLYELCQALKGSIDLEVLVSNDRFKTEIEQLDGYRVVRVGSLGYVWSTPLGVSFGHWMRRSDADIFHFQFPYPVAEVAYLLSGIKRKVVVSFQVDVVHHPVIRSMLLPFLMRFLQQADRIIVSSANLIESSGILGKFKDKCTVVPLGIDVRRFGITDEIRENIARIRRLYAPPILLFVGRLVPYKGVDILIKAMNYVKATLLIVGEGPSEKYLKRLTEKNGLTDKIHFLGTLSEKELIWCYHACEVFVLPSLDTAEAFGIVQLEAHACGKPVVSTNLPTGVTFVNLDGVTGLVVPPGSSESLAEGINNLLRDDRLRQRLGEQARARVNSEFTAEVMARKMLNVYNEVMKGDF